LPALVAELVGLKVDVLVVTNSVATRAAMKVTRTIPIVMFARQGLVTSLMALVEPNGTGRRGAAIARAPYAGSSDIVFS
jgi:ABC-type uncharacterized transport system substrate-binding protein